MGHYTPTSPTVSVLMAVCDADKTVRRAVESLLNQTLKNFELVVVDRGSKDSTLQILDSLAERDMRVQVIRADGCNRLEALNTALERSCGSYLVVMDADGWADREMLEQLVDEASRGALDLVIGGFDLSVSVPGVRPQELRIASEHASYPTQHDFRAAAWEYFATGQLLPASAKLFCRSLVMEQGVRFKPTAMTDHSFVMSYLRDVERVGVLGGVCYHVQRSFSLGERRSAGPRGYRLLEAEHTALLDLYRRWGLSGDVASVQMLQSRYLEQLAGCVESTCGWGSAVSSAEQRRLVEQMINSERAQLAASVAQPRGNSARAMVAPIRSHNVALACVQARLVSLLRRGKLADVIPDSFV